MRIRTRARWVPLVFSLAGCSGDNLEGINKVPTAEIVSPAAGTVFTEGDQITFEGVVGDPEDDPGELTLQWVSDKDLTFSTGPADAQGLTSVTKALSANPHTITLQVTDRRGATTRASIGILVNSPPEATIGTGLAGVRVDRGAPVTLTGTAVDHEDDESALDVFWYSDVDGLLGQSTPDSQGNISLEIDSLSSAHHTVSFEVEDTANASATSSDLTFTVNSLPEAAITGPDPAGIFFSDRELELTAQVGDHPDEDRPADLQAVWESDRDGLLGEPAADGDGRLELKTRLTAGNHTLTLTVTDSLGGTDSATLKLLVHPPNGLPSAPKIHLTPENPGPEEALRVVIDAPAEDPEGETVDHVYEWRRNGSLETALTGQEVPADLTQPGEVWSVTVYGKDPYDAGATASDEVSIRVPDPPTRPEIAVEPESPDTLDALVLSIQQASVDPNPEKFEIDYDIRWFRDGTPIVDLDGAYTVPPDRTVRDEVWKVVVTAKNPYTAASPVEAQVRVRNTAPVLEGATVTPDHGNETTVFSVDPVGFSDLDDDRPAYRYEWLRNGAVVGTGRTLDGTAFSRGDEIRCRVYPSDGTLEGTAVETATVRIENTPPSFTKLSLGPVTAYEDTVLEAVAQGYQDLDGDKPGEDPYHYRWFVNGKRVEGALTKSLSGTFFNHFDRVEVEVAPFDGESEGTALKSEPVTILNRRPAASSAVLSPADPGSSDTLSCLVIGYTDSDGDPEGPHVYEWTLNGQKMADAGSTLAPARFERGDVVGCRVTPSDGYELGEPLEATPVTIQNGSPYAPEVRIDPPKPRVRHALDCLIEVEGIDPDGEKVTHRFSWYRDGQLEPDFTQAVLPAETAVAYETWTCRVTPADELGLEGDPGEATVTFLPDLEVDTLAVFTGEIAQDSAGYAVTGLGDVNGDDLPDFAIGAPFHDPNPYTSAGKVYLLFGRKAGWGETTALATADASYVGTSTNEEAGKVLSSGDLDGDGLGDLVIAAPSWNASSSSVKHGRVYIVLGRATGWQKNTNLSNVNQIIRGAAASEQLGSTVAVVGDLNGDGYDDLALGGSTGEVHLIFGREKSLWKGNTLITDTSNASYVVENVSTDKSGLFVSGAGDVNGDGLADLLIGAPRAAGGFGAIYLVYGRESGWTPKMSLATADHRFTGEFKDDSPGGGTLGVLGLRPLAAAGDVDGDGLGDFLIGAAANDSSATSAGKAYLFLGSSAGSWDDSTTLFDADLSVVGEQLNNYGAGQTVTGLGDLDGDGLADYLIGAPAADIGGVTDVGSISLWPSITCELGTGQPWSCAAQSIQGLKGEYLGGAVAPLGDVNDDGRLEFLVAAPKSNLAFTSAGAIYLMTGP